MSRKRMFATVVSPTLVAVGAVAIAACGGSSSSTSTTRTTSNAAATGTPPPSKSAASGRVDLATSDLGKILVDSRGRTLYLWQADTGPKSTCSGACAAAWPPFETTGAPNAGSGVNAGLLGTTKRSDGSKQVTYNQHPLYLFKGDTASGQTNGQGSTGFGALWYVVSTSGTQITRSSSRSGSASGSSSTTGY
jgi:predicted lipoprotein with Yx(FWY)xxD motif